MNEEKNQVQNGQPDQQNPDTGEKLKAIGNEALKDAKALGKDVVDAAKVVVTKENVKKVTDAGKKGWKSFFSWLDKTAKKAADAAKKSGEKK